MLYLTMQSLWARRRRLVGTSVAVMLGVAFLVGTLVLGDTIAANFDDLFSETAAGTDVVVRSESPLDGSFEADPGRRPLDVSLIETVGAVDGIGTVEPQVTGYGQLLGADGDPIGGNGPPRLAGSWITTPELNPYELAEGRAPQRADEVVINRGAAESGGLSIGDRAVVQLPQPVDVTIVGISTFGGADGLGETTMTAFTLEAARDLVMRDPGTVSSILVRGAAGQDADELDARISEVLPAGVESITGDELVEERLDSLDFLGMLRLALVAFAAVALFVAALSINNAFSITIAQRTRELALLRSIGATRRQVRRIVTLEALTIGAVASVIGAAGGLLVATFLKAMFAGFGFALPTGGLTVERSAVVVGLTVGIVVTLLAARAPGRRASRVAPIEAMQTAATGGDVLSRRRLIGAVVCLVAGAGMAVGGVAGVTALVGLGGVALVTGTLLVAPGVLPAFATGVGAGLQRLRGVNGSLATQNAQRQPHRTASTATALLIGVTVVAMFTVFASSAADRIQGTVSDGFGNADLAIATPVFGGGVLSPDVMRDLDDVAEIDDAVGVTVGTVVVDGDETQVAAAEAASAAGVLDLSTHDGALDGLGPDDLVVERSRAEDAGWEVGSTVELTFLDGATVPMNVGAVIEDTEVLESIVVPTPTWFEHAPQPAYTNVFMTLADGASLDEGRAAITGIAGRYTGDVQDRDEFADSAAAGLDMLLALVYVMLALAIVISLLGIANTLSMAVHERRHEIGLLRAVGQTRRQTRSVLRLESVIVAAFGTAAGLALGTVLGSMMTAAVFDDAPLAVPTGRLGIILVLGIVSGMLAAARPARRAARLDVLDAIATA